MFLITNQLKTTALLTSYNNFTSVFKSGVLVKYQSLSIRAGFFLHINICTGNASRAFKWASNQVHTYFTSTVLLIKLNVRYKIRHLRDTFCYPENK